MIGRSEQARGASQAIGGALDKDKVHRLEFNSSQRNADGRECCWVKDPEWQIADDKDRVVLGHGALDDHSFNYRVGLDPRGLETSFGGQAELDGIKPKPWQPGPNVGYPEGPLKIVIRRPPMTTVAATAERAGERWRSFRLRRVTCGRGRDARGNGRRERRAKRASR